MIEDGWDRVVSWASEHVGPTEIQLNRTDGDTSPKDLIMAWIDNDYDVDSASIRHDVQPIPGIEDMASCTYRNASDQSLLCAAKTDQGAILLVCEAKTERFAEFARMFRGVVRSVRIGKDPNLHAAETLDVPAEKLKPEAE